MKVEWDHTINLLTVGVYNAEMSVGKISKKKNAYKVMYGLKLKKKQPQVALPHSKTARDRVRLSLVWWGRVC